MPGVGTYAFTQCAELARNSSKGVLEDKRSSWSIPRGSFLTQGANEAQRAYLCDIRSLVMTFLVNLAIAFGTTG
jgi:hypothetical protein